MKLARPRRGDSADMSVIEFVDREGELRKARTASPSVASMIYGDFPIKVSQS